MRAQAMAGISNQKSVIRKQKWASRLNSASGRPTSNPALNPHRHQHVERALGVAILDQRRRSRIGQLQDRGFALELRRDVEQIAGIEADIEWLGTVFDLDLLG